MKSLYESLLDDFDTLNSNIDPKKEIKLFIEDNYSGEYEISAKPNKDGLYEVSAKKRISVKNTNITTLTNDLFIWDKIGGDFDCSYCNSLTSLKGAPKEVKGAFDCSYCDSLTSLEDAPKEIGRSFYCSFCSSNIPPR